MIMRCLSISFQFHQILYLRMFGFCNDRKKESMFDCHESPGGQRSVFYGARCSLDHVINDDDFEENEKV